jgi:2,3-bisphosphoglycerate-independent phosphoglycerate mutase
VDDGLKVVDPRAGMIQDTKKLAQSINGLEIDGIRFRIYPSLAHRAVLRVSGNPVAKYIEKVKRVAITDTDPHKTGPIN